MEKTLKSKHMEISQVTTDLECEIKIDKINKSIDKVERKDLYRLLLSKKTD
jgi:hypothetical protein